jgi:pyruvate,water dikinase
MAESVPFIVWFGDVRKTDVSKVGGKNASLGEMISQLESEGVSVPHGFATTTTAYRAFLAANELEPKLRSLLDNLDVNDTTALFKAGAAARNLIYTATMPDRLANGLKEHYDSLTQREGLPPGSDLSVAVRSSATAEDLPEASFAGQQETYLNVCGHEALIDAVKKCFASLFTDRAIVYRVHNKFGHLDVALSCGIQTSFVF